MKGKILIVDDVKDTCVVLEEILTDEGYQAFSALNWRSALDMVKKKKPDLVLLDIKMPEMDGIEVMKRIKQINKDIAVVMMSAYATVGMVREVMRLGAYYYLDKPFDINLIKATVKEALSERKQKKAVRRRR